MISAPLHLFRSLISFGLAGALMTAPALANDPTDGIKATSVAGLRETCRAGLQAPPRDPLALIARHDAALAACGALLDGNKLEGQALIDTLLDRADLLAPASGATYQRALADYARVIALAPNMATAFWKRGKARLLYMRDLRGALRDLDSAIRLNPSEAEFHVTRASIHSARGERTMALRDLDRAVALAPRLERAWTVRGLAYLDKGDLARAIADFDEAIRIAPDSADNYRFRAAAWRTADRAAEAASDEAKAQELSIRERSPGAPAVPVAPTRP